MPDNLVGAFRRRQLERIGRDREEVPEEEVEEVEEEVPEGETITIPFEEIGELKDVDIGEEVNIQYSARVISKDVSGITLEVTEKSLK